MIFLVPGRLLRNFCDDAVVRPAMGCLRFEFLTMNLRVGIEMRSVTDVSALLLLVILYVKLNLMQDQQEP